MNKTIFSFGIVFGINAIILGAFGAHGLESRLEPDQLDTFETGVKYQMYHALFLLVLGQMRNLPSQLARWVFLLTLLGIALFSFSIYFLATNELTGFDFRKIGFVTPIGGLLLISAWTLLGIGVIKGSSGKVRERNPGQ